MEFLAELIAQFLIELFGELLLDQSFRRSPASGRLRPLFYGLLGLALGGLSLLIFSHHLIAVPALRVAALLINPALIGVLMMRLGSRRRRTRGEAYGLEHFWPAWALAFGFGLVRVLFAA